MEPRQSQPSLRLFAMMPAPTSPKSNALFLWKGCLGSAYCKRENAKSICVSYAFRTGTTYWNVHVAQAQSVKQTTVIVTDVVQHHAFALVEANSKVPFLPWNDARCALLFDLEARTLGLNDIKRLEIGSQRLGLGYILVGRLYLVLLNWFDCVVCSSW